MGASDVVRGMMNFEFDPTQPLLDIWYDDTLDAPLITIEQPQLSCSCDGTRWIAKDGLYKREPKCTCPTQNDDFVNFLHADDCDAVPCPFCPLENSP